MLKTKITVINLPPSVVELFGGKTSVDLDLSEDTSIRLSNSVEQLSLLNKLTMEGALGMSLDFTAVNDRVFSAYLTPLTVGGAPLYYDVRILVGTTSLQFTRAYVRGKDESARKWEIEFARDPNHWVELASQTKLSDLDYGTFVLNRANIVASWANSRYDGDPATLTGGSPVYWPLVDYGAWCDQTQPPQQSVGLRVKSVANEDFRPWISLRYMLQAGFCKFGWSFQSVLFESEVFRSIWVYALRQDYFVASDNQRGGRVTGMSFTDRVLAQSLGLRLDEVSVLPDYEVTDVTNLAPFIFCGVKNHPNVSLKYNFRFNGQFKNETGSEQTISFGVFEIEQLLGGGLLFSGEMLSTATEDVVFAAGETKTVSFDQTVVLGPKQMGAIRIQGLSGQGLAFKTLRGLQFSVDPANESYMTGDTIDVRLSVSSENNLLDWVKAVAHLCDGRIETDFETRTVTLHPNRTADFWGQVVPSFIREESPSVDIDQDVIPNSIKTRPTRVDLKRFTRFQFKDSTDAYVRSLNLITPPHSRTVLNNNDLPNEIEKVQNLLIEPTLEGQPAGIASGAASREPRPFLMRLWDNTDGNRSFAIGPRVGVAYPSVRQVNPSPINDTNRLTSFFLDTVPNNQNTGLITDFGYMTQSPTWAMTPAPPQVVDFVFGVKARDLFTTLYLGYTQRNRSGSIVELLLLMNMSKYSTYKFRDKYKFRMRGIDVSAPMIEIRDFSSGTNTPTPTSFFVEPAALECCDLPCGCQFVECEYYQDFGIYMRQTTLNALRITSFVVDGIELVSAPITLGTRKVIDVGGKPYITNLVDKLNSIGAPYFSFSYSNREHPSKGLRYFKIKKLLCSEFEIVLSDGTTPKYRYSNTQQQQQWFQSSWGQMGYGTQFTDVPENCLNTTEY
ncbi:MAG: hypothetical protein ACRCVX_14245 [Shewanella sp.]